MNIQKEILTTAFISNMSIFLCKLLKLYLYTCTNFYLLNLNNTIVTWHPSKASLCTVWKKAMFTLSYYMTGVVWYLLFIILYSKLIILILNISCSTHLHIKSYFNNWIQVLGFHSIRWNRNLHQISIMLCQMIPISLILYLI